MAGLDRYLLINSSRLVTASAISSITDVFSTHPRQVGLSCFTASSNAGVCRPSRSADSLIEANDGSSVAYAGGDDLLEESILGKSEVGKLD